MAEMQFSIDQLRSSRSLANELVETLRRQITEGNLAPGTKLPAAKEIEQQAGVSRGVVREAVAALKAEGLIVSRQGVGMFIASSHSLPKFEIGQEEFSSIEDAVQILELRMAVEVETSARAAENRSARQMRKIWDCLEDLEEQITAGEDSTGADFAFHLAIADASGNPYFARFIKYVGAGAIPAREIITTYEQSAASPKNYLTTIQQEHQAIVEAIQDQNADVARVAMRTHLGNSRERHVKIIASLTKKA